MPHTSPSQSQVQTPPELRITLTTWSIFIEPPQRHTSQHLLPPMPSRRRIRGQNQQSGRVSHPATLRVRDMQMVRYGQEQPAFRPPVILSYLFHGVVADIDAIPCTHAQATSAIQKCVWLRLVPCGAMIAGKHDALNNSRMPSSSTFHRWVPGLPSVMRNSGRSAGEPFEHGPNPLIQSDGRAEVPVQRNRAGQVHRRVKSEGFQRDIK